MDGALRIFLACCAGAVVILVAVGSGALSGVDARIWQAVVAGVFLASGWLVNGWQDRRAKAALRAEKLRDYHKALFAEIRTTLAALNEDRAEDWEVTAARISADFKPFVPRERHDRLYDILSRDIDVLPRQTIDVIVAYYSQIQAVQAMAEDLRAVDLSEVGPERVSLMYRDYLRMRQVAFSYGEMALEVINAYSEGGRDAAVARLAEISSRAGGRGDHPSEAGRG